MPDKKYKTEEYTRMSNQEKARKYDELCASIKTKIALYNHILKKTNNVENPKSISDWWDKGRIAVYQRVVGDMLRWVNR